MGKHTPYTSEPSNPHSSKSESREHVDLHHYGEGGRKDDSLTVPHLTDEKWVDYGRQAQEHREDQKK